MTRLERSTERRAFPVGPLKRISWGAIFGGSILSVAIVTVLGVLGVALGAMQMESSIDEISPRTMGLAAGVWWIASGMLAVFIGAAVASRLAGFGRRWEGALHGIITWALTTVAAFALTTSVIVGMQHQRPHAVSMVPDLDGSEFGVAVLAAQSDLPEALWRDVQREATQLLRESVRNTTRKATTPSDGDMSAISDTVASDELEAGVTRLYRGAKTTITMEDKKALIDVLVRRADVTQSDAERYVERWAMQLAEAWSTARHGLDLDLAAHEMEETKLKMSTPLPSVVSGAAWFTFLYLLVSAIAAGIGGKLGAPNHRFREASKSNVTTSKVASGPHAGES